MSVPHEEPKPPTEPSKSGRPKQPAKPHKPRGRSIPVPVPASPSALTVVHPDAAGIDVHSDMHMVCVPADRDGDRVRQFGANTADLQEIVAWLKKCRVTTIALESTGVYWIPLFELLESEGFQVSLIEPGQLSRCGAPQDRRARRPVDPAAAHLRPVARVVSAPGFRAGFARLLAAAADAGALCRQPCPAHAEGPGADECQAGGSRQRHHGGDRPVDHRRHPRGRTRPDGAGQTARSAVSSQRGPDRPGAGRDVAARTSLRASAGAALYQFHHQQITECDEQVAAELAKFADRAGGKTRTGKPRKHGRRSNDVRFEAAGPLFQALGVDLTLIEGIDVGTALVILAEIGVDVSRFPTEKHFASWLRLCPPQDQSNGTKKHRRHRKGTNRVAIALRMAARSVGRTMTPLGLFYRRIKSRTGGLGAVKATAHKLACLVYRMLKYGQEYVTQTMEDYEAKLKAKMLDTLKRKAAAMGFELNPLPAK